MRFYRVAIVFLVLLPAAFASPGPGYQADGTLQRSLVVAGRFDDYYLTAQPGQTITATASWDPGQGSLVLAIQSNEPLLCDLPDAACLVELALEAAEGGFVSPLCGPDRAVSGTFLAGPPQTVSLTATTGGEYAVSVIGGVVLDRLDYHLHVDVDGAAPTVRTLTNQLGAGSDGGLACGLQP